MPDATVIPVARETTGSATIVDPSMYARLYEASIRDPERFWAEHGRRLDWIKPYSRARDISYGPGEVRIRWYEDGTLNAAANCIDRHLRMHPDRTAIIWEGDDPAEHKQVSYRELHEHVCRLANALKGCGVQRGDRVAVYLPMIPEAAYAILACARIGAVHSVVFAGFSPDSLASRINDCGAKVLITADEGLRGGRKVPLEKNGIKRVPVIRDGRLVGIVSRANLIRALAAAKARRVLPAAPDDSAIRVKVLEALRTQPWSSLGPADVTVADGAVGLWGVYRSEQEREAARVAAENVPGVRRIEDHRIPPVRCGYV